VVWGSAAKTAGGKIRGGGPSFLSRGFLHWWTWGLKFSGNTYQWPPSYQKTSERENCSIPSPLNVEPNTDCSEPHNSRQKHPSNASPNWLWPITERCPYMDQKVKGVFPPEDRPRAEACRRLAQQPCSATRKWALGLHQ